MRIHLHVGPPKTGTSSLQKTLLTLYGAPEPQRIWYPIPERMGDGHADVMTRLGGQKGGRPEPTLLDDIAQRALGGGCQDLVISSEACTALVMSGYWPQLASLARYGEVRPIVTLQPIGKRISSFWQEMAKNLVGNPMEKARTDMARNLMELRLVSRLVEIFPGTMVHVIFLSSEEDPGSLFRRFAEVTGLALPERELTGLSEVVNRSLGRMETDIMAALGQSWRRRIGKEDEYRWAQGHLLGLFNSAPWRAIHPRTPIGFTQDWVDMLAEHARTVVEGMKALRDSGKIAILGDVEKFDDVARPYKWPNVQIHKGAPMVAASVILQTSNHGEALRPAVESALKQSLSDLELIIVGDDCDAQTRAVATDLAASDKRIRFQDHRGSGESLLRLHNALGEARGRFVAYLDGHALWLPHHLQTLADLLEEADLVHSLQVALDKNGDFEFAACDLANPDLRHLLVSADHFRFDSIFAGHRLDAYRRLAGGWNTVSADAKWPDVAMWRQFLSEPWCRARSVPEPTGLSLRNYLHLHFPRDGRAAELRRFQALLETPDGVEGLRKRSVGFQNRQAVGAQLARWTAEAQLQEMEARSRDQQAQLTAQQAELGAQQLQLSAQQDAVALLTTQLTGAGQKVATFEQAIRSLEQGMALLERRLQRARARRTKLKKHWAWRFTRPLRRGVRWLARKTSPR